MHSSGILYAIILGVMVWLISYFLTVLINTVPALYIFPGMIIGIVNGFLIVFMANYYVKKHKIKFWMQETLIFGLIIGIINYTIDYYLAQTITVNSINLLSYPVYVIFSMFGGYLASRKK